MIKQDYLLRLLNKFLTSIQNLKRKIKEENIEIDSELGNLYIEFLDYGVDFYKSKSSEEIITFFKERYLKDYLIKLEILAELNYLEIYDCNIPQDKKLIKRTVLLFDHLISNSKTFSQPRINKLRKLRDSLE